jgi:glycosyltransferase involved in cell wall biosynthesis
MDVLLTVVVCTYNRCEILAKALNSLALSTLPSTIEWEALVVDNNSADRTRDVVEGFCRQYPGRFRYVLEPRQGLSFARNAGVRESRGDVLVFLDDDATVDTGWLWSLTAALHSGEWAGAGGPIIPRWDTPLPIWLSADDALAACPYGTFDAGQAAGPLARPPFGSNMAFRKEVFEKYGGFRTDLGRSAHNLLGGEDTEFGKRLLANGEKLRYEPSAVVHHMVAQDRVQKGYVLAWWFWHARSEIGESGIPPGPTWSLAGIPLHLFRRLAMSTMRWLISIKPSKRFSWKRSVWYIAGEIIGCYQWSRGAPPQTAPMISGPDTSPERSQTGTPT